MIKKKILLVEDNPDDELLTINAFEANNVLNEVIVARNGAEALEYLFCEENHATRNSMQLPTVVLLDLKLPKIDGLEVLRRIRLDELTRLLPVVILTSSNEEDDQRKSYALGANSYVRKPVDYDEFIKMAAQLGLYWLSLNESPPRHSRM